MMQFYYGPQMPLRILDEAEFWKHQEEEHTVVIRELVSGLETPFVEALFEWEKALSKTHQQIVAFIESIIRSNMYVPAQLYEDVRELVQFCLDESEKFIEMCRLIKNESDVVKNNMTAKVVLDHIIRESEYFIGISRAFLYQNVTRGMMIGDRIEMI